MLRRKLQIAAPQGKIEDAEWAVSEKEHSLVASDGPAKHVPRTTL